MLGENLLIVKLALKQLFLQPLRQAQELFVMNVQLLQPFGKLLCLRAQHGERITLNDDSRELPARRLDDSVVRRLRIDLEFSDLHVCTTLLDGP